MKISKATLESLRARAHEERVILVLKVDLTDPKNRLRPRDRMDPSFRLLPFDRATLPRVLAMAEEHEPWRVGAARRRFFEGARGFVAEHKGAVVGHVFYTEGTDHPTRLVHSDLRWLEARPRKTELYAFDYFLIEPARGLGNLFARSVQDEHHRMGYTATYGWVLQGNRPAVWLYRTTGWSEVGRVVEHRLLSRLVVVGRTVYWMKAHSRTPIANLPPPLTQGAR